MNESTYESLNKSTEKILANELGKIGDWTASVWAGFITIAEVYLRYVLIDIICNNWQIVIMIGPSIYILVTGQETYAPCTKSDC